MCSAPIFSCVMIVISFFITTTELFSTCITSFFNTIYFLHLLMATFVIFQNWLFLLSVLLNLYKIFFVVFTSVGVCLIKCLECPSVLSAWLLKCLSTQMHFLPKCLSVLSVQVPFQVPKYPLNTWVPSKCPLMLKCPPHDLNVWMHRGVSKCTLRTWMSD